MAILLGAPTTAVAAGPDPKWTVEVYGGAGFGLSAGHGKSQLPPPGETFLPAPFSGVGNTRAVSSWYFGDGALLFNQNQAAGSSGTRIIPLDSALIQPAIKRTVPGFGVRVDRVLTRRLSIEFDLETGRESLTRDVLDAVEVSRKSLTTAFEALFSRDQSRTVSSTATIDDKAGRQIVAVGGLRFSPKPGDRVAPYVSVGAGIAHAGGSDSTVVIAGDYEVVFSDLPIPSGFHQRDQVTVRYRASARQFVAVVGGGVDVAMSAHSGFRIDTRVSISRDAGTTFVSATPVNVPGRFGAEVFGLTPSLSFSGSAPIRSSLSGPAFTDFTTFSGGDFRMRVSLTVGYFLRF